MAKISVVVASTNPVKMEASKLAFEASFPDSEISVSGVSVESGVSDQPMSSDETLTGAQNRCSRAMDANKDADFWVGIEGGLKCSDETATAFAWIVVMNKEKKVGKAHTASFELPPEITKLIAAGKELGHATDEVFGATNSKQAGGACGYLTGGIISRTELYKPAVVFALLPFMKNNTRFWA
eukprot:TRINITY_DN95977_c0_g1_i1.p1 TRINITY_DN95977_c0_g1~~TRINITY_DN95977_c0_g1_i1.p1  ORF type:complete len:182 (+),score=22.70 TRINITY_DN95977_c0_g1_i1:38-583(+)